MGSKAVVSGDSPESPAGVGVAASCLQAYFAIASEILVLISACNAANWSSEKAAGF